LYFVVVYDSRSPPAARQTTLDCFQKREFQTTRLHSDFVWLHERYLENDEFAGFVVGFFFFGLVVYFPGLTRAGGLQLPPCPPKPDFSQSHGKLAKLQANEGSMSRDELEKLKGEIQSEYLAAFQKTVAMHEVFLLRLATHSVLRTDTNFQVFLEYDQDVRVLGWWLFFLWVCRELT
jgi:sorting nexin-5/6/32